MCKLRPSLLILLSFLSSASLSSTVQSVPTKISEINSYSNFPNGDTLIQVDNPHSSCPGGYWLKMSDLSFSKNMSLLLSSFHSQSNIIFYADNSSVWPHNPQAICHISQIKLVR